MKKHYFFKTLLLLIPISAFTLLSFSSGNGNPLSGSPGDGGNNCTQCHSGSTLDGTGVISLTSDIPAAGFIGGTSCTMNLKMKEGGINRFGFQTTAYGETTMGSTGAIAITDMTRTQLQSNAGSEYVTHTSAGSSGQADSASWSFAWTPSANDNKVTFYVAGNAANDDGSTAGDKVYLSEFSLNRQFGVSLTPEKNIVSLKAFPSPASQNLFVSLESKVFGTANIVLLDLQGREVYRYEDDLQPGAFSNIINVSTFPTGIYTLRVQMGEEVASRKVMME